MYGGSAMMLSGSGSKGSWSAIHIRNGGSHGVEMEGNISLDLKKVSNCCIACFSIFSNSTSCFS
jgi:hypothetical protein